MSQGDLLPKPLTARLVRAYINFDGKGATCGKVSRQAEMQSKGVAALWHLLQEPDYGFAYLGDEVGMGKTRQAMGAIATQFLSDPNSHVVIVCPGRTLQEQWAREWDTFVRTCYKGRDNRLTSALDGSPVQVPQLHDRLRDFAQALLLNESRIHLLRYSSFSRPIWFGQAKHSSCEDILREYGECLNEIGLSLHESERRDVTQRYRDRGDTAWRDELTSELNRRYAALVGELLRGREIDLVVFDEAQYLRNVDNQQNTNIRQVFCHPGKRRNTKWLFLSATPLHSSNENIKSLDRYLCTRNGGPEKGKECAACPGNRCPKAEYRLGSGNANPNFDVVDLLREFLVRRTRAYPDANGADWGKVHYRNYRRVRVSAAGDPFLALTTALVQKRLVRVLEGQNNKFRLGECSSFESLASSVKRCYEDHDGNRRKVPILEGGVPKTKQHETDETLDSRFINALNRSFNAEMHTGPQVDGATALKYTLPHAKLNQESGRIFDRSLRAASNSKSLVFVRRIETVQEFLDQLMIRFQEEVDLRLEQWRQFLLEMPEAMRREQPWRVGQFWSSRDTKEDAMEIVSVAGDDAPRPQGPTPEERRTDKLPYFVALKRSRPGSGKPHGMLASFRSRLLPAAPTKENPLGKLFSADQRSGTSPEAPRGTQSYWTRFICAVTGMDGDALQQSERYRWLLGDDSGGDELAVLKRCILQSLRQTDFLVDLYVLNRFVNPPPPGRGEHSLPEKLLWFLGDGRAVQLPPLLQSHLDNWKAKLLLWLDHFDLIVDKTLRGEDATTWEQILHKVDDTFLGMEPATGRSSRMDDKNAVKQFNFPTHPNVLVCTDVLKEGVDLHLFCDEVSHYGVAWTSGDLEQRIGRVDRFASLISRKIGAHRAPNSLPQLNVEFPYLEGTLDEHQVRRVILEKFRNDRLMDLGKREDELKELSLKNLEDEEMLQPADFSEIDAAVPVYYPKGVPEQSPADAEQIKSLPLAAKLAVPLPGRHVPAIGSVVLRREGSTAALLCRRWAGGRGKFIFTVEEEHVVPEESFKAGSTEAGAHPSVESALLQMDPVGVRKHPMAEGFAFDHRWNTLVCEVEVTSPYLQQEKRKQTVLLERAGAFWLLRTPVMTPQDGERGSERWIASQNHRRRWGYLVKDQGIVWFVLFVLADKVDDPGYLEKLGERIGKTGDRLQHLHICSDDHRWNYRSHLPFTDQMPTPALPPLCSRNNSALGAMDERMAAPCPASIKGAREWLRTAFKEVVGALYGDVDEGKRRLRITQSTSRGAVLRFSTEGAERFSVQAFLELLPRSAKEGASPRVIWEVVVTPYDRGAKPMLPLSDPRELPHNDNNGWIGAENRQCAVYTAVVGNYRHLTLYHAPHIWDASRQDLLRAWSEIADRMQGATFQQAGSRNLFLSATSRNCSAGTG